VRRGRAPAWIADVRDDPDVLRAEGLAAAGCLSCLAVPVLAGGEVTGMLEFFGTTSEPPNDAVLGAMGLVGVQLGRVFERDRARRRERFVQSVVDHVADPIFVKDNSFRFVFLSRALCEMVGQAPEKMLGRDDYDFFPKEQADFFRAKDQEMFTSESRVVIEEEPITDAAGRHHVLATTKVPLRDDAGKVTHLVGVIHDITQLKAVQDELRLKNQLLAAQVAEKTTALAQLAVAHEELEAFTYTVSHDLRAPLASISGFTELVLASAGVALGPVNRGYLQRARAAVDRMARLMDDLLQLSQMGRQPMHLEPVDLAVIAREVVADLRRTDPERHVDVVVREPMAVVGDPPLLRVVLENLLGNAWKFTARQAHARVEVGAAKVGGAFACYVRDNGAGFEMADAARLFQPFQRLHRSDEFAGTGVGLASVRRIVERHGGRVWAEGAVSEGADIWFTLPEAPGAQA
jgi:PAS domain S-box-containing protein